MQKRELNNKKIRNRTMLQKENNMLVCCRELVLRETSLIVDRSVSQPIHAQVSNYIRMAIADGRLPAGARIPSIRELADALGVAINTIARAYKDLSNEGLIESMPGRGTVVSVKPLLQGKELTNRTDFLRSIIQPAARKARMLGYEWNDILRVLEESIAVVKVPPSIGLVASSSETLDIYRRTLEEELADLDVSVIPVILKDLKADMKRSIQAIAKTRIIVSLPDSFSDARSILEERNKRVIPLLTELSIETHNQLAQLPYEGQIVLMCREERKSQYMWLIGPYCHPAQVIWVPGVEEEDQRKTIEHAVALIYDEGIPNTMVQEFFETRPGVRLQFVLNVQSVQNLRNLLLISSTATINQ